MNKLTVVEGVSSEQANYVSAIYQHLIPATSSDID